MSWMWSEQFITLIPSSFTGTIDVGTGQMTSVIDLASLWVWVIFLSKRTPNEPDELCADVRPIMELGWFPTVNILDCHKPLSVCDTINKVKFISNLYG